MAFAKDYLKEKLFKDEVGRMTRELFRLGFLPYDGFGEVSVRDNETGKIYGSIKPGSFHVVTPDDYHGSEFAVLDADGKQLNDILPAADGLALHVAVYKARPDVTAIIRTNSHWASQFAQRGEVIPFVLEELIYLGGSVRCVTDAPTLDAAYCQKVVEALGEKRTGATMKDYGTIAVAENLDTALMYLGWIESVAQKVAMASALGEVKVVGGYDDLI